MKFVLPEYINHLFLLPNLTVKALRQPVDTGEVWYQMQLLASVIVN